jgi:hypothetical protein
MIERIDSGCASNLMRVLIRLTAPTYSVVPDVLLKALELVEEGKLSETSLTTEKARLSAAESKLPATSRIWR